MPDFFAGRCCASIRLIILGYKYTGSKERNGRSENNFPWSRSSHCLRGSVHGAFDAHRSGGGASIDREGVQGISRATRTGGTALYTIPGNDHADFWTPGRSGRPSQGISHRPCIVHRDDHLALGSCKASGCFLFSGSSREWAPLCFFRAAWR